MIQTKIDGEEILIRREFAEKYGRPGPRYTSYPTAPNWTREFGGDAFANQIISGNKSGRPLSLYFHIPFCEERCTFCACSVVATKRRERASPYLETLLKETEQIASLVDTSREVEQIHWGGGTPTYLNCGQIEKLYGGIRKHFTIAPLAEVSVEIDPRVTSTEQLAVMKQLGFNRASLGVQDFDPEVQKLSGRVQLESKTRSVIESCRAYGYESVNIDLVYGLPKQTRGSFQETLHKVLELRPDRVALFNFAYVPWLHPHQKKILEKDLPDPFAKLEMFCDGIASFQEAGYEFIGLDHFAKKGDELAKAKRDQTMYRNFQGYTTKANCDLIGLGVSAISHVHGSFAQNEKKLKTYEGDILNGRLSTRQGLKLKEDDRVRQWVIRELFCHQGIERRKFRGLFSVEFDKYFEKELKGLRRLEGDHLITLNGDLKVTPLGRLFLRNIGMIFDAYLKDGGGRFSKTL